MIDFVILNILQKGGFGKVYKANWIDGPIDKWGFLRGDSKRKNQDEFVALKSLNNSTLEFMNEVFLIYYLTKTFEILFLLMFYFLDYVSSENKCRLLWFCEG